MMRPSEEDLRAAARLRPAAGAPPEDKPASSKPAASPRPAATKLKAEWYVGIDGEPVGPIDTGYMRSQIDAGKVDAQSLVWKEEMSDWQPLSAVDELRALLSAKREARAPAAELSDPIVLARVKHEAGLGGATELAAPAARGASAAPIVKTELSNFGLGGPTFAASSPATASPAPPSPGASSLAAASSPAASSDAASSLESEERAATSPDASSSAADAEPASHPRALGVVPDAPAPTAGDLAPESERVVDAELAALGIERRSKRRGINPMAWAFVAMATAFGAVSAWFLFSEKPQPVADAGPAETTAAPTPIHDPPPPPSAGAEPTGSAVEVDPIDMGQQSGSGTVGGPLQKGNDKPPTSEDKTKPKTIKPCSPDDPFCGTGTPDGPTAESKSGSSGESSAGLTQDQAQSVVSQYKGSLMRRCRSMVTKGGAKVFATITVGRSGAVQSASVSGGNEYPGLASCVRQRIMNWSFPASGGTTTVNVSFNFL
jgi:hypothetical protein